MSLSVYIPPKQCISDMSICRTNSKAGGPIHGATQPDMMHMMSRAHTLTSRGGGPAAPQGMPSLVCFTFFTSFSSSFRPCRARSPASKHALCSLTGKHPALCGTLSSGYSDVLREL